MTKEDIKTLMKSIENLRIAAKDDIEGLRKDVESLRMATKEDIESLRKGMEKLEFELKSYVDARINDVKMRISDLYGVVKASLVAIVVTLASTILVPLILKIFF